MIDRIMTFLFGSQSERDIKALKPVLEKVNAKENWAHSLPAEEYPKQTQLFKDRLAKGETLEDILPEAFALAREAAYRISVNGHLTFR